MSLTKAKTQEIFKTYGGTAENTGSIEGQIALFTERINHITAHLQVRPKDKNSRRSLIKLVGKRRDLLNYLTKKDIMLYRSLIEKLGLRK